MSKTELDNLLNPVGSTNFYTGYAGGFNWHVGSFSSDNPYYEQLKNAISKQDRDALYERAVEWQADRANQIEQRQFDRAVLEEQREYDSPEAQMLRMRKAGINPDLAGSSGSGSSIGSGSGASMQSVPMADQSGSTPFSSGYADKQLLLEGVNSAAGVISTLVNGYGVIADSISKFRMLPSQIKVNEASAGLMDSQSNEINTLLSGKKKSIDLSNSMQYVGLVTDLAGMIKTDASDDEFKALVSAAGIDPAHADSTISAIKQAQSTPEFLNRYKNNILANREADAKLRAYTSDVFNKLIDEQLELQELELDFDILNQSMANKVQTFLSNSPGYLENLADAQTMTAQLSVDQLEFAKEQFKRDLAAYEQSLESIVVGYKKLESRNNELRQRAKEAGRDLDPIEELEIESNTLRMGSLYSLGSQQVHSVYGILDGAYRQKFYLENNTRYDHEDGFDRTTQKVEKNGVAGWVAGKLTGSGLSDDTLLYGQIAFGDILQGTYTSHDLVKQYGEMGIGLTSNLLQYTMLRRLGGKVLGDTPSPASKKIIQDASDLNFEQNLRKVKNLMK